MIKFINNLITAYRYRTIAGGIFQKQAIEGKIFRIFNQFFNCGENIISKKLSENPWRV